MDLDEDYNPHTLDSPGFKLLFEMIFLTKNDFNNCAKIIDSHVKAIDMINSGNIP